uniref:Uncharacterized protein n=1 Tax=Rhizophora mucronata TaxID=61149 RepID=A0A2P2QL65_RHIMU
MTFDLVLFNLPYHLYKRSASQCVNLPHCGVRKGQMCIVLSQFLQRCFCDSNL